MLLFVRKKKVDELDVTISVPISRKSKGSEMLGYPKRCNYLCANGGAVNIMGYPKNCSAGFGPQCNKKCDCGRGQKRKSAFRKTCLPLKG